MLDMDIHSLIHTQCFVSCIILRMVDLDLSNLGIQSDILYATRCLNGWFKSAKNWITLPSGSMIIGKRTSHYWPT